MGRPKRKADQPAELATPSKRRRERSAPDPTFTRVTRSASRSTRGSAPPRDTPKKTSKAARGKPKKSAEDAGPSQGEQQAAADANPKKTPKKAAADAKPKKTPNKAAAAAAAESSGNVDASASKKPEEDKKKTIIIEYCKQCNSFKTRAEKVKSGLDSGVRGITVLLNPDKPRKGCFEIREDGGEKFISLLDMKRPFKPMKDLDMDEVIADIIEKIKD